MDGWSVGILLCRREGWIDTRVEQSVFVHGRVCVYSLAWLNGHGLVSLGTYAGLARSGGVAGLDSLYNSEYISTYCILILTILSKG
jgi:hypothetical protein